MRNLLRYLNVAVVALMLTVYGSAVALAADFVTTSHAVTVDVPESLSISADTGAFTLTMPSHVSGSVSNTQTVVYTVNANKMSQADGAAAMNLNLDFLYDRLDFEADAGDYTSNGGNTALAEAAAGYSTIGTSNVGLVNKTGSTGAGDILDGSIPITYRATATDDVPTGTQVHTLFVTLTTV